MNKFLDWEGFLNLNKCKILTMVFCLHIHLANKIRILEVNNENGSARIQCDLYKGDETKKLIIVYDKFLTLEQKKIKESYKKLKVL